MKYNIARIILPIIFGLLCAVACDSKHNYEVPDTGSSVVQFGVQDISKAVITNNTNIMNQDFVVFGDMRYAG